MPKTITPFLMFEGGVAEAAMNLYVSLFEDSRITRIERYAAGEPGAEGSIKSGEFVLAGQPLRCLDSAVHHQFTFTPSLSLFVECSSEAELREAYAVLAQGGADLMPPGNYGFSELFAWINDRFGVSWQLNWSGTA